MSQRRDILQRIRIDMVDAGATPAFDPVKMREQDFREISGAFVDFTGTLRKLPRRVPIAGQITEPNPPKLYAGEEVLVFERPTSSAWPVTSSAGDGVSMEWSSAGVLRGIIKQDGVAAPGYKRITRSPTALQPLNTSGSYDGESTFEFSFKASALPPSTPTVNDAAIYLTYAVKLNQGIKLNLTVDGVQMDMTGGSNHIFPWGKNVLDNKEHKVRVVVNKFGIFYITTVYVDGIDTLPDEEVLHAPLAQTFSDFVQIELQSSTGMAADEVYSIGMWNFLLRDDADDAVVDGNVKSGASRDGISEGVYQHPHKIFVGTDRYVWVEDNFSGIWTVLTGLVNGNARFSSFRESMIIVDYGPNENTRMLEYDKQGNLTLLDDAPNGRVFVQHANRGWTFGDKWGLRLYYSGDRNANIWFSPDTDADGVEDYDEVMDSGYVTIPGKPGEVIRAACPEFYGVMVVITNMAAYSVSGTTPSTFTKTRISSTASAFNQESVAVVGTDIWSLGESGISQVFTTDKYGDLLSARVSLPIQGLFSNYGRYPRQIVNGTTTASMAFEPVLGLVAMLVATTSNVADTLWLYNIATQKWYGPTPLVANRVFNLTVGYPAQKTLCFGFSDGWLKAMKAFEEVDDPISLKFACFTGRSVSPLLETQMKTWKFLRLFVHPHCRSGMTLRYRTEGREFTEKTINQMQDTDVLENGWTVGVSTVNGEDDVDIIDIPIDTRGKSLHVEIDGVPPYLGIVSAEIEFINTGYDRS